MSTISSNVETRIAKQEIESISGSRMTYEHQRNEIGFILQKIFKKHGIEYAIEIIKELNLVERYQIHISPEVFETK